MLQLNGIKALGTMLANDDMDFYARVGSLEVNDTRSLTANGEPKKVTKWGRYAQYILGLLFHVISVSLLLFRIVDVVHGNESYLLSALLKHNKASQHEGA